MANIFKVLEKCDQSKIHHCWLHDNFISSSQRKYGTEITFGVSNEIGIDFASNVKTAIIVFVDVDEFNKNFDEVQCDKKTYQIHNLSINKKL